MNVRRRGRPRAWQGPTAWLLTVSICVGLTTGCQLIRAPAGLHQANKIPALRPPPDAVALDIVFIERPMGDALLGTELWKHVDEVASLSSDTRGMLRQNGLRVGVVGSHPPEALQTMLGLRSDYAYEPAAEQAKLLVGHKSVVRSGGETEIQTSPEYERCTISCVADSGARSREYELARCLFRVTSTRIEDGWVRLDFVPQVQFGPEQLRHVAGDGGWQFSNTQKSDVLFTQRFSLTIGTGEMVVITMRDEPPGSLGRVFFAGPEEHPQVQRVLLVRLGDMPKVDDPWK